jgi:hypothetical protein
VALFAQIRGIRVKSALSPFSIVAEFAVPAVARLMDFRGCSIPAIRLI